MKVQFHNSHRAFNFTDEYLDWLIDGHHKNLVLLSFIGVQYCTDDDNKYKCRRCERSRRNRWSYIESLAANLLYLSVFKINEFNGCEVRRFEDCLFDDFINNMNGFYIHVTDSCNSQNNEFSLHILNLFRNVSFNKRLYNGANPAILANCYSNQERMSNMTCY
ncbi:unnamed protein product [Rotaria magnacalcarata]|uniref:Uncharacterized protein n=1 Tax=Rotaria magnacalcarata TaxID=392030 RepID=A0A814M8H5_9BILA|nr:unnamed protein product [Rotaria magnacalcarata]CAF2097491.1 unnamed protein product [Rotaria magnacalcarata]CAF4307009.1 unnamed protein product [Rotaria magnacalcarata]